MMRNLGIEGNQLITCQLCGKQLNCTEFDSFDIINNKTTNQIDNKTKSSKRTSNFYVVLEEDGTEKKNSYQHNCTETISNCAYQQMNPVKLLRIKTEREVIGEPMYESLTFLNDKEYNGESCNNVVSPIMHRRYKYKFGKHLFKKEAKLRKPPLPKRNKTHSFTMKGTYIPHHRSLHNIYTCSDNNTSYCKIKQENQHHHHCEPIYADIDMHRKLRCNLYLNGGDEDDDDGGNYCEIVRNSKLREKRCKSTGDIRKEMYANPNITRSFTKSAPIPFSNYSKDNSQCHCGTREGSADVERTYENINSHIKNLLNDKKTCPLRRHSRSTPLDAVRLEGESEATSMVNEVPPFDMTVYESRSVYENVTSIHTDREMSEGNYEYMGAGFEPITEEDESVCDSLYENVSFNHSMTESIYDNVGTPPWSQSTDLLYADVDFDRCKNEILASCGHDEVSNLCDEVSTLCKHFRIDDDACSEEEYTQIDFQKSRGLSRALRGSRENSCLYELDLSDNMGKLEEEKQKSFLDDDDANEIFI